MPSPFQMARPGVPITRAQMFYVPARTQDQRIIAITGVTRDSNSNLLGACTVKLYTTAGDVEVAQTVSDGSGNYSFTFSFTNSGTQFYIVAYKAGSPDVSGTTVNTLVGA